MEGVSYLHACNVFHRDLKIENVMLTGKDTVQIIDFGLSMHGDVQPAREGQRGTPSSMAPEVASSDGSSTLSRPFSGFKADIWSCGVILFLLLAGTMPYQHPNSSDPKFVMIRDQGVLQLMDHWLKNEPWAGGLAAISAAARDLLAQMMHADPARRPNAQAVLGHPWLAR
jgi:serine/threonine protein kinase